MAVPHYHQLATRMSRALVLQQVTFRELWHTSRALEPACVDQAMDNATEEDFAALAANIDEMRKVQGDPDAVGKLDAEFHKLIGKAAHNRVLLLAKEPSGMLVRPVTAFIISKNPRGIPRIIEAHHNILEALAAPRPGGRSTMGEPPPQRLEGGLRGVRHEPGRSCQSAGQVASLAAGVDDGTRRPSCRFAAV